MRKTARCCICLFLMVFSFVHMSRGISLAEAGGNQKSIIPIISYLLLQANRVKIDYYVAMGDSITKGNGDDEPLDDYPPDDENIEKGGYPPILNKLLSSSLRYSITIINEGVGGTLSIQGVEGTDYAGEGSISSLLDKHVNSQRFLVQYGTNDANQMPPVLSGKGLTPAAPDYPGSFKHNMQQIIDAVQAAGKEIYLGKPPVMLANNSVDGPPFDNIDSSNTLIREYGAVLDELVVENDIALTATDFYELFDEIITSGPNIDKHRYEVEYFDYLHPNGTGYQSIANLWHQKLMEITK